MKYLFLLFLLSISSFNFATDEDTRRMEEIDRWFRQPCREVFEEEQAIPSKEECRYANAIDENSPDYVMSEEEKKAAHDYMEFCKKLNEVEYHDGDSGEIKFYPSIDHSKK